MIKYHSFSIKEKNKVPEDLKRKFTVLPKGDYLLIIIGAGDTRTINEWMKYYRALVREMSNDLGYSAQEVHEILKEQVLSKMNLDSTTELVTAQRWREYIERAGDWALKNFDFII